MLGHHQDPGGGSYPAAAWGSPPRSRASELEVKVKVEDQEDLAHLWETRWQEFLHTVEAPQLLPEPSPSPWDDAHGFLTSFEQVAKAFQWPEEEWVIRLRPALGGEAEQAYSRLEVGDREDYGKMKAAILRADALSREKQRQHFRHFCYEEAESPREVYNHLQRLCCQWLNVERHTKEEILEILILEQFLTILPPEMQRWVRRESPEGRAEVISLAEDFLLRQQVPEITEQEAGERPGARSANWQHPEGPPSTPGQKLQLGRELKQEEDADADLWKLRENESHPPGRPRQAELPRVPLESSMDLDLQDCPPGETSENWPRAEAEQAAFLRPPLGNYEAAGRKAEITVLCPNLHQEKREKLCQVCGKVFTRNSTLHRHEKTHTGIKPYRCFQCDKGFYDKTALRRHQRIHNMDLLPPNGPLRQAAACSDLLPPPEEIGQYGCSPLAHRRIHKGQEPSAWTQRVEGSEEIRNLQQGKHKLARAEDQPYKCSECGKNFHWFSSFQRHKKIHLRKKSDPLLCKQTRFEQVPHAGRHPPFPVGGKPAKSPGGETRFTALASIERPGKVLQGGRPMALQQRTPVRQRKSCPECGKSFEWAYQLRRHQRVHTGEKPFLCPRCGKSFKWNTALKRHLEIHKQEKPKTYMTQGKFFPGSGGEKSLEPESDLVGHQQSPAGEKPHRCTECGETFIRFASLNFHQKHVHRGKRLVPLLQKLPSIQGKPYRYFEHGEGFNFPSYPINHRPHRPGEKPYKCPHCEKSFLSRWSLQRHRKVHESREPGGPLPKTPVSQGKGHICPECGKSFSHGYVLIRHQRIHTGEKPYKCAKCGESFRWSSTRNSHQKKIHAAKRTGQFLARANDRQRKPYGCSECGKRFRVPSLLSTHQTTHTGEKQYQCTICRKNFFWQSSLRTHLKKFHKRSRPVPTLQPPRRASQGSSHPQPPPARKKPCKGAKREESFVGSPALPRHRNIHVQEKPSLFFRSISVTPGKSYPCSQCGKSFSWPSYLLRHQQIHTREKLSKSPGCGESVPGDSEKIRKGTQTSEKKQFQCSDCGETFPCASNFLRHQSIHAGEKLAPREENFRWRSALERPQKALKREKLTSHLQSLPSRQKSSHPCPKCGRGFTKLVFLRRHQRVHAKANCHQCAECGKSFRQAASVKRHQLTHSGERFHCSHCTKSFVYRDSLMRHLKSHPSSPAGTERGIPSEA